MADFKGWSLTNGGKTLLNTLDGLIFTKAMTSISAIALSDVPAMTILPNAQQKSADISKTSIGSQTRIAMLFTNEELANAYNISSIGLYVADKNGKDVLFAVGVLDQSVQMPAVTTQSSSFGTNLLIGISPDKVNIAMNAVGYALQQDVQKLSDNTASSFLNISKQLQSMPTKIDMANADNNVLANANALAKKAVADGVSGLASRQYVDDLKYENRNLLLDSGFESGKSHGLGFVYTAKTRTDAAAPSGIYAAMMEDASNNLELDYFWTFKTPLTFAAGQSFTISYDYSASGDAPLASDYWFDQNGASHEMMGHAAHDIVSQRIWKRVSFTYKFSSKTSITMLRFGFQHSANTPAWKAIDNIKIELGSTATPHSYAPEDTITDLASLHVQADRIDQAVSSISTAVNDPKTGLNVTNATATRISNIIEDKTTGFDTLTRIANETSNLIKGSEGKKGLQDSVSDLKQRADSFDLTVSKVNALSFENRNLLLDSGFESGNAHGLGTVYDEKTTDKPKPSGKYAVVFTDSGSGEFNKWWTLESPISINDKQSFTISYDYAVGGDAPRASDYWYDESGTSYELMGHSIHNMANQRDWKRVSYTYTSTKVTIISKLRFGFVHATNTPAWKVIDNIKIELGSTATPHSYAIEDIQNNILNGDAATLTSAKAYADAQIKAVMAQMQTLVDYQASSLIADFLPSSQLKNLDLAGLPPQHVFHTNLLKAGDKAKFVNAPDYTEPTDGTTYSVQSMLLSHAGVLAVQNFKVFTMVNSGLELTQEYQRNRVNNTWQAWVKK